MKLRHPERLELDATLWMLEMWLDALLPNQKSSKDNGISASLK